MWEILSSAGDNSELNLFVWMLYFCLEQTVRLTETG